MSDRGPRYADLLTAPHVVPILASQFLSGIADAMWLVALLLFTLARFHSPVLAGAAGLINQLGVLFVPVAGALLDRRGRKRLILLDYTLTSALLAAIAGLSLLHGLNGVILLLIVGVTASTTHLSWVAYRTLLPALVPRELWDRAIAVNLTSRSVGRLIGPAVAGVVIVALGPEAGILLNAVLYAASALLVARISDPHQGKPMGAGVFHEAAEGIGHVMHHPILRDLVVFPAIAFVGWAAMYGAMPVLVEGQMHGSGATVGFEYGFFAAIGIVAGVFFGRIDTASRAWQILSGSALLAGVGLILLALANIVALTVGMALLGVAEISVDQTLYATRRRHTEAEWDGRATAIASGVDTAAYSIGIFVAGCIAGYSPVVSLVCCGVVTAVSGLVPIMTLRRSMSSARSNR